MKELEETLQTMMNYRLRLTRKNSTESIEACSESEFENDTSNEKEKSASDSDMDIESESESDVEIESESDGDSERDYEKVKEIDNECSGKALKSNFLPPLTWKEHYCSHFASDIRQLGPLPLLNTDRFESKVGKFLRSYMKPKNQITK